MIPASVNDAAVLTGTTHDAPESVMRTLCRVVTAAAVQLVNPTPSTTVGDAGTTNPLGNTTVIVRLPVVVPLRFPTALVVNPAVHVDVAPADCGFPEKATPVTEPGLTAKLGLVTVVVSALVATVAV